MDDQPTLPSSYRSFVACGGYDEPYAPAFKKLLVTEVDTHTHTHTHTHMRLARLILLVQAVGVSC